MKILTKRSTSEVTARLQAGEVGILLTDTLYGVVASANNLTAVERIYTLRERDSNKPCIVLIANMSQIWGQSTSTRYHAALSRYWPGPVSIVLPVSEDTPTYLHRGTHTLAYRLPADKELQALLAKTGPLIAPSANLAGKPPATNITEAQKYFGQNVDFYVDSGPAANNQPSRLIKIETNGTETVLR